MKNMKIILTCLVFMSANLVLAEDKGESHTTVTNAEGSTVTVDKSHSDSTGWTGTKKYLEEEKTVVDPSGLNNKASASRQYERKVSPDGAVKEQVEYKHADGTSEKLAAETDTSKHWTDSGKTTTSKQTHVIDPKGLGNKQELEVTKRTDVNPDGSSKTTVTKKLNGTTETETAVVQ